MIQLPEIEYRVLQGLLTASPRSTAALAGELSLDQSRVHAACLALAGRELVTLEERGFREVAEEEASEVAGGRPLPARRILAALERLGGQAGLAEVAATSGLDPQAVGQTLRWLKAKGWTAQEGRELALTDRGRVALVAWGQDELLLAELARRGAPASEEELTGAGIVVAEALELLTKRKGLVRVKNRTERLVSLTVRGRALTPADLVLRRQVNLVTPEMLQDGAWREVDFRPYDVTLGTARVHPGKQHPLRRIFAETRRVFLEMGFSEIVSPLVESSFWDFDALFQPQDHPAREMQDTFYVPRPARTELPDPAYVAEVGRTHEHGGKTGSVGWRYRWNPELASRPVLRTHSTAATVRGLASDPHAPRKIFLVGQVFRRETVDYKHLPVFHQVDGVVIDEKASFAMLLGILDAFYRKMGFARFQFRPAFFPYTEPSVEIFVWLEERKDWVEMGGAGVFRPEVTEPTGCHHPVLAWGLGLERLAMLRFGLKDIRDLYLADIDWLKGAPLCR